MQKFSMTISIVTDDSLVIKKSSINIGEFFNTTNKVASIRELFYEERKIETILKHLEENNYYETVLLGKEGYYEVIIQKIEQDKIENYIWLVSKISQRPDMEYLDTFIVALDFTNVAIWMVDDKDRTTYINKAVENLLGYSKSELLGKNPLDFISEEDKDIYLNHTEKRKEMHKNFDQDSYSEIYDLYFTHKQGHQVPLRVHGSALFTENNFYVGNVGFLFDIQKERQLEREKELYAQLMSKITETSASGIFVLNIKTNKVLYVNKRLLNLVSLKVDDLNLKEIDYGRIGRKVFPDFYEKILTNLKNREYKPFEAEMRNLDGIIIPVRVHVRTVLEEDPCIVITVYDLSSEKNVEHIISMFKEELLQKISICIYSFEAIGPSPLIYESLPTEFQESSEKWYQRMGVYLYTLMSQSSRDEIDDLITSVGTIKNYFLYAVSRNIISNTSIDERFEGSRPFIFTFIIPIALKKNFFTVQESLKAEISKIRSEIDISEEIFERLHSIIKENS